MLALTDATLARVIAATKPLEPEARSAWLQCLALRFDPPHLVNKARTARCLDQKNQVATSNSCTTSHPRATGT